MRGNEFLDKLEFIDPAYVEEADERPTRKRAVAEMGRAGGVRVRRRGGGACPCRNKLETGGTLCWHRVPAPRLGGPGD